MEIMGPNPKGPLSVSKLLAIELRLIARFFSGSVKLVGPRNEEISCPTLHRCFALTSYLMDTGCLFFPLSTDDPVNPQNIVNHMG